VPDLTLRPPLVLIMAAAACWTFWCAVRRPERFPHKTGGRARAAVREGVICSVVWSGTHMWFEPIVVLEVLYNGLLAGVAWVGVAWWSKGRYT
jgi:hypothetical protein